jgi:hypothetical protein
MEPCSLTHWQIKKAPASIWRGDLIDRLCACVSVKWVPCRRRRRFNIPLYPSFSLAHSAWPDVFTALLFIGKERERINFISLAHTVRKNWERCFLYLNGRELHRGRSSFAFLRNLNTLHSLLALLTWFILGFLAVCSQTAVTWFNVVLAENAARGPYNWRAGPGVMSRHKWVTLLPAFNWCWCAVLHKLIAPPWAPIVC